MALIDLIIMQITLVPDSVTPAIVLVRHLEWAPFFQYYGSPQFLNFYNMVVIFKPNFKVRHLGWAPFFNMAEDRKFKFLNFYKMANKALILNLTLKSAIFKV